jgi:hypothetical protein
VHKNKFYIDTIKDKFLQVINTPKLFVLVLLLTTIIVSLIRVIQSGIGNNYFIYRYSFLDLMAHSNMYVMHEGLNYYLYSPSFPLIFAFLAAMPHILGNIVWNLINIIPLLAAIYMLPFKGWKKSLIYIYPFFQIIVTIQISQVDNLILALCLFTFIFLEKNKIFLSALSVVLCFFIKIYGIGFAVIMLFYKKKYRFIFYLILSILIIFSLPLFFINFDISYLLSQYHQWIKSMGLDTTHNTNVIGCMKYFGLINYDETNVPIISLPQIISLIILALPLLRKSCYDSKRFKLFYLSSLLIWVVIFNHKAESSQFLIALTGISIWFVSQPVKPWTITMLIICYVGSSLLGTDLAHCIKQFVNSSGIQAIPSFILWIILQYQLLFNRYPVEDNAFFEE